MTEELKANKDAARASMDKAIEHLRAELTSIRAGRANISMLDGIMAEAYGSAMPLNQLANITTPDSRTLSIQPWDKTVMEAIERAIMEANIGLTPQNDGENIRLNIPQLTEERRKDLVKQTKALGENAKVSVRNARKDANDGIKQLQKDGLSEDMAKDAEADIQGMTNSYGDKIDDLLKVKEEEIMTV